MSRAHTLYRPGEGRLASTSGKDFPKRAGREFETEQAYPISIGGEHAYSWLRLLLSACQGEKSEAVGREVLSRAGIPTKAGAKGRRAGGGDGREGGLGEGRSGADFYPCSLGRLCPSFFIFVLLTLRQKRQTRYIL